MLNPVFDRLAEKKSYIGNGPRNDGTYIESRAIK